MCFSTHRWINGETSERRRSMVKKIQLDFDMITEIDLHDNAVYVVARGRIISVDPPPSCYGKQEISLQKDVPIHTEIK